MNHIKVRQLRFGFIFLVPPKGHPIYIYIYTLTNIKQEPYMHSPKTVIQTLLHFRKHSSGMDITIDADSLVVVLCCQDHDPQTCSLPVCVVDGGNWQHPRTHPLSRGALYRERGENESSDLSNGRAKCLASRCNGAGHS